MKKNKLSIGNVFDSSVLFDTEMIADIVSMSTVIFSLVSSAVSTLNWPMTVCYSVCVSWCYLMYINLFLSLLFTVQCRNILPFYFSCVHGTPKSNYAIPLFIFACKSWIIIIIAWLVHEWTLLFPRATSMQKVHSWETVQLRCPRYSSPGKRGQVGWPKTRYM